MRNAAPEEMLKQAIILRSSIGRNPRLRIQERVVSRQKSIQGLYKAVKGSRLARQMQQQA